ncbi:telomerase reverse transcriptase-like [Spodoptera litura]|uniref:Telomerase reverse transcriptase n=1 Tax=Spodoptera litura TaxID=69820 RepID=A0A9J7EG55_SPOLT|nr:telomerase reverse transcriptase-like [Spodoptera litura]
MESPVCLSQYFVNKQNVRSFNNIIKCDILKHESVEGFVEFIFGDGVSVSDLPPDFINILSGIKINLRNKSKLDFHDYFPVNSIPQLRPVDKEYILNNCWKAINEIFPRNFYGHDKNKKIIKDHLRTVVYSMKRQHFILQRVIVGWDLEVVPWKNIITIKAKLILLRILFWLSKYVLSPMICLNFYVTTCKLDANENKLHYFWKNQWQSFYDKQVSKMVFSKVMKKCEINSLGKKTKKNHNLADRLRLKMLKRSIPKLYLTLKPNNDCRPIVCYKNELLSQSEKYRFKDRLKFLRSLTGKPPLKLENQYKTLHAKWAAANKPKLYFIKTDLSNAFGCINREKLSKILSEKHINMQKTEKCIGMKKKIAQQYRDLVTELRKPILIRAGSTVYEWKEGLVQGYKYSPALSELYYTYLDEIYFCEHMKQTHNQVKLFIRVVDDYLYITDSLADARFFLNALSNYRNVNYEKTTVNFPHESIKQSEDIFFLGYCYNTVTMQVSRANNIFVGQMCYKIAFTSGVSEIHKFIESRIGQSGIPINSHIFNLNYNNEELIWKHIFTTFCLSANKFCTIMAILCNEQEMKNFLWLYKKRVAVKLSNSMIEMSIKNKPSDFIFMYCINHFRYLSWKALYLCAKQTPKCSGLVPAVNDELRKSDCIFGKWREHARRIDTNGECERKSIREVCRRSDLRKIFREFDVLPKGFECYHHKRLL